MPALTAAAQDFVDGKGFDDKAFDEAVLGDGDIAKDRDWGEWLKIRGLFMINPDFDDGLQRSETVTYAKNLELVSDISSAFMGLLSDWCSSAMNEDSFYSEMLWCNIMDSFATGNPLWPVFDIRNFKKDCEYWVTCYEYDFKFNKAMNNKHIVSIFEANTKGRHNRWRDCKTWTGIWHTRREFKMGSDNFPKIKFDRASRYVL